MTTTQTHCASSSIAVGHATRGSAIAGSPVAAVAR